MTDRGRSAGAHLVLRGDQPLRLMLQVAGSEMEPAGVEVTLRVSSDGAPVEVRDVSVRGERRMLVTDPAPGRLPSNDVRELVSTT